LKISVASAATAVAVLFTSSWLRALWPPTAFLPRAAHVATSIVVGLCVLALTARALRIAEFAEATGRILRKVRSEK
jgi:hypothetical protein